LNPALSSPKSSPARKAWPTRLCCGQASRRAGVHCGAGAPARSLDRSTGEDARFTLGGQRARTPVLQFLCAHSEPMAEGRGSAGPSEHRLLTLTTSPGYLHPPNGVETFVPGGAVNSKVDSGTGSRRTLV